VATGVQKTSADFVQRRRREDNRQDDGGKETLVSDKKRGTRKGRYPKKVGRPTRRTTEYSATFCQEN